MANQPKRKERIMNVDELTLGQVKEIRNLLVDEQNQTHPWRVGEKYLIRTVTLYALGRLTAVYQGELVLEDASWVSDTGRWHTALETGELNEVEPHKGALIVSRGAIVDAVAWTHELPREAK